MNTSNKASCYQPLASHIRLKSKDFDEFRFATANNLCDHKCELLGSNVDFNGKLATVSLGRTSLHSVRYDTGVHVSIGGTEDFYTVNVRPDRTNIRYKVAGKNIKISSHHGALISPTIPFHLWQDDNSYDMPFTIQRSAMDAHLSALIGQEIREPIEFAVDLRTDMGAGATARMLIIQLARQLENNRVFLESPVAIANFEDTIMNLLLLGQAHNYTNLLSTGIKTMGPKIVLRAEEYIKEYASEPITMVQIAKELDINIRTLNRAFQRFRNYSPIQFLKTIRLENSHQRLLQAETEDTISKVVLECGFTHLGRFSHDYLQFFGEYPRETLKH